MSLKTWTRYGSRTLLFGTFAFFEASKLRDSKATQRSIEQSGIDPSLSKLVSKALPISGLILSCGILSRRKVGVISSYSSFGLFAIFTGHLWRNIIKGNSAPCACFGQHLESISGWSAIFRNVMLMAISLHSADSRILQNMVREIFRAYNVLSKQSRLLIFVSILGGAVLAFDGWRRVGTLAQRGSTNANSWQGPEEGTKFDTHTVIRDARGDTTTIQAYRAAVGQEHQPMALIFIHPDCDPCVETINILEQESTHPFRGFYRYVTDEVHRERLARERGDILDKILFHSGGLSKDIGINVSPTAIMVDDQWIINKVAIGSDKIANLLVVHPVSRR